MEKEKTTHLNVFLPYLTPCIFENEIALNFCFDQWVSKKICVFVYVL